MPPFAFVHTVYHAGHIKCKQLLNSYQTYRIIGREVRTMMVSTKGRYALQVCLDSGAKKVLLPMTSAAELGTVPADLIGSFNLIFYSSAEDAVFKALGVE